MMQWLQSLSRHCIRSHAPEITLTSFSCFPFCIMVKHKFVHRTWKAAKGLIYLKPVLRKHCLPANLENKLKVIRMKGWKYRGRVKSWCSAQYWLKLDVSNVTPLQEGWRCGVSLPHITRHCCLPRNHLLGQSQAPAMPREPSCCWHSHLQSGAAMSCTSPIDMGCSWHYNISERAIYTPTSSSEGKRGAVLCVCPFLPQE